jgi:hypothetical protein
MENQRRLRLWLLPTVDFLIQMEFAVRIGISAVVKRLGFLLEALAIGKPEGLRRSPAG